MVRARDDADAFAVLFRRHVDDVHRFVSRRIRDQALADDLTATTFERCWQALPTFEPRRSSLRPWLLSIAANEIASHCRSDSRRRHREEIAARRDVSDRRSSVAEQPDDELVAALGALDERHQVVLSLRFLADLSTTEAAAAMHVGARHFAVMQYRALAALRRQLEHIRSGAMS